MPALPPYLLEPIWQQFEALLPQRRTDHPLGCHRSRIPERVVFEKLVEVLVFGCAYHRIADASCSESTLRRRRDEWIELGVMERLRQICLDAYDRLIGLELSEVAVDCCVSKAPRGGEKAGSSPVDRGKRGIKRSMVVDARGIPVGNTTAPANRSLLLLTSATPEARVDRPDNLSQLGWGVGLHPSDHAPRCLQRCEQKCKEGFQPVMIGCAYRPGRMASINLVFGIEVRQIRPSDVIKVIGI